KAKPSNDMCILFYIAITLNLMLGLCAQTPPNLSSFPSQKPTLLDATLKTAQAHEEFQNLYFKQHEADFVRLVKEGQSPKILFIGCSDSRVIPEVILNSRPGDLFVIRTAGNFVTPYHLQSID